MRELFVYYRVPDAAATAAQAVVRALHERLRQHHPALRARLLRRPGSSNGVQTWMETYAIDAGIDAGLEAEIDAGARDLLALIDGPRHTEVFVACAW